MPARMMRNRTQSQFVCSTCQSKPNLRKCNACGKLRAESEFPATRWNQVLKSRSCFKCSQSRSCSACHRRDSYHKFPNDQWDAPDAERLCNDCVPKSCPRCRKSKRRQAFSKEQWMQGDGIGVCKACEVKRCGQCKEEKSVGCYNKRMWNEDMDEELRKCVQCSSGKRKKGYWTCTNPRCDQPQKPIADFSRIASKKKIDYKNRKCNTCIERLEAEMRTQMLQESSKLQVPIVLIRCCFKICSHI